MALEFRNRSQNVLGAILANILIRTGETHALLLQHHSDSRDDDIDNAIVEDKGFFDRIVVVDVALDDMEVWVLGGEAGEL